MVAGAIVVVVLAAAAQVPVEHVRRTSPDGRFIVVTHSDAWRSALPMMPGSGSDKPGVATLYASDGHRCGRVALERLNQVYDLRWTAAAAIIPRAARWNLAECASRGR